MSIEGTKRKQVYESYISLQILKKMQEMIESGELSTKLAADLNRKGMNLVKSSFEEAVQAVANKLI